MPFFPVRKSSFLGIHGPFVIWVSLQGQSRSQQVSRVGVWLQFVELLEEWVSAGWGVGPWSSWPGAREFFVLEAH